MRIIAGILSVGLLAGITTAAQAETNGWYAGAEAGATLVPSITFKDGNKSWRESHEAGYSVLGQVGYGFGPLRVEGELGWRSNGVDKIKEPFNASGNGRIDAASVFANGYYDVATGTAITPFIGAGVGGVDVNAAKVRSSGTTFSNDDQFVFGYQGIVGASYAVSNALSIKADYRYLRTLDAKLKEDASYGAGKAKGEYAAHALMVGFTYKFGAPAPVAAPAPAPIAAPAPVAAPAPKQVQAAPIAKNYLVFFDFDKSDITADASKIIAQAAASAKANHATSIALTGHTDASGSDKYNQALSIRRGNAVKASLVKLGIPAGEISVVGKGKSDPLVATKDGVKEPQNRRVQIVLP